ncbi:dephospho-CoA kinase [Pyrodictium occultum]|uniref:Dephospho-CoA kinase n=2 Tax=Pyrodictium occultum TaxID=2309 RepID=A0A0V8RX43_PYROC|nr:dephospho-CoA kinase [Pyrodictium occultum]
MPGSGKSLFSSVAREMGLPVYVMGDVVREEARRRGLEPTPSNLNMVARLLRKEEGPAAVALRVAGRLERGSSPVVVVDGVRSLVEVEVFQRLGRVITVAVHASPRTRFERLRRRGRPGDPGSWEEFRERDMTELSFSLGSVIALADYMLVNEGPVEEFLKAARGLLERLLAEAPREPPGG